MAPAQQPVYLVDFSVYKPPEEFRVNETEFLKNAEHWPSYTAENGAFICKVVKRSGLEMNATYLPAAINPNHTSEPHTDMKSAMVEAELVMGTAVESVLRKTGLKPEQVDILITNTSIFCPTPSLASMLINKFKFRKNVQVRALGGLGFFLARGRGAGSKWGRAMARSGWGPFVRARARCASRRPSHSALSLELS